VGRSHAEIRLPFQCWKLEGKKIAGEPRPDETVMFKENLIAAFISPPFEPMTDVKLTFDFCAEAHCFHHVYAKVLPAEKDDAGAVTNRLRITSMNQKDRGILRRWILEASLKD
jgi:hypothetical protein